MNEKSTRTMLYSGAGIGLLSATLWTAWAQSVPQPVLKITQTASNEFQIFITNGVPTASYELYTVPVLDDAAFPWQLLQIGNVGQSNFVVQTTAETMRFFQIAVGLDWDGDGIPNSQDGDPNNSAVGRLNLFIDGPANGATFD